MSDVRLPRIIIPFAGRFYSEKAASIFVDLNARSFVDAGVEVVVIAPRRLGRLPASHTPYATIYLPVLDLSRIPYVWEVANYLAVWSFSQALLVWLLVWGRKGDLVISNDVLPLLAASLVTKNLMYEMHDYPDRSRGMYGLLFRRVRWILATNAWKAIQVQRDFGVPEKKVFVERNAVDVRAFGATSMSEARSRLNISLHQKVAVYTGHLYEWKGADTLARAAALVPELSVLFVGGTSADVARFRETFGDVKNIRIVGHVPHEEIPLWQSAADMLVLPNSAKEELSVHYTSPMKLFEYMASSRPIVASDLPSIREVLPEDIGYYAKPDDPESFASALRTVLSDDAADIRSSRARAIATDHTWAKRAQRILQLTV